MNGEILAEIISRADLRMTCPACPSQWEGTTVAGEDIYIRYRFGGLTVSINDEYVWGEQIGDSLDGDIGIGEVIDAIKNFEPKLPEGPLRIRIECDKEPTVRSTPDGTFTVDLVPHRSDDGDYEVLIGQPDGSAITLGYSWDDWRDEHSS